MTARNEVVLSAGAINTPQLLLLSGIGARESLIQHGIAPRVDLPDVGRHLKDHPFVTNYWTVASNATRDGVQRDPGVFAADLAQWQKNRTGLFSGFPVNTIGFFRIPEEDSVWERFDDPTAGEFLSVHGAELRTTNEVHRGHQRLERYQDGERREKVQRLLGVHYVAIFTIFAIKFSLAVNRVVPSISASLFPPCTASAWQYVLIACSPPAQARKSNAGMAISV